MYTQPKYKWDGSWLLVEDGRIGVGERGQGGGGGEWGAPPPPPPPPPSLFGNRGGIAPSPFKISDVAACT